MDITWADIQRQEDGLPPAPLAFTGDYLAESYPNGLDDDDLDALNLAMDRDQRDREGFYARENQGLRAEIAELRARLGEEG
jgi:hypothetical protein